MPSPARPLFEVEDLRVTFGDPGAPIAAVAGASLSLGRERVGIVGESGSGKSTLGRALLGLAPPGARVSARRLVFDGIDLLAAPPATRRALLGRRMSLVMQDPRQALNPVMRIGDQIAEGLRVGDPALSRAAAARAAVDALAEVRIREPARVARLYPHEISGGMGQRAMIAMMLAPGPNFLVADEMTSALDPTTRLQVLAILDDLVAGRGMGLLFIAHDLDLVASFCDRVVVMEAGRLVEECAARDLHAARHPTTRRLLSSRPGPRPSP